MKSWGNRLQTALLVLVMLMLIIHAFEHFDYRNDLEQRMWGAAMHRGQMHARIDTLEVWLYDLENWLEAVDYWTGADAR